MSARRDRSRHRRASLLALAIAVVPIAQGLGQGVAAAAVQGSIVTAPGAPASGALVTLVNTSTGAVRRLAVGTRGSFLFDNVPVGGPYRLEGRFIGFEPASIDGIILHLGDRLSTQLVLNTPHPHRLDDVEVRGSSLRDAGAGGPAYSIPGQAVRNMPLRNRDFVGLFAMVPQATGSTALSISGQHVKFNAIQIDGGSANDFFGVNLAPGAGAGGRAISLEALDEIRVLVAPFDVRQSGFSGGLINAVTRSGTNVLRGSTFVSHSRSELVGADTAGNGVPTFNVLQYGVSLGGPLIRNRLHFFAVADIQSQRKQFVGPSTSDPATGISDSTARRAAQLFRDRYALDAGGPESPALDQPNTNLFLKLSWQSPSGHWLELSHSRLDARNDTLNRSALRFPDRDGWQLSRSGFTSRARTATTRVKATSTLGSFTNEMIASAGTIADNLESVNRTPLFLVQGDLPSKYLAGGSVKNAQGTETDQRVIELTDNVSWSGGNHLVTVGTQNQLLHFHDNFFPGSWGVWTFGSVDALERREPLRYEIALPLKPGGPLADYSVAQLSGYLQDRWNATQRVTVTAGLRADVPRFDAPSRNPLLASDSAFRGGGIDTGLFPSGNAVISPRLGFAWDVGRDHGSIVRGGIGAFTGRPAYAWLTNAYSNTGQEQTKLVCAAKNGVPTPTTDITQLPQRCSGTEPGKPLPSVAYFASDFRFQQAIKYVLGADHDFDHGVTASIDLIHTRTRNNLYVSDVNLVERGTSAEERVMYGAITRSGSGAVSLPTRMDSVNFQNVYRFENNTVDRSTALSVVLQKQWVGGTLFNLGYN